MSLLFSDPHIVPANCWSCARISRESAEPADLPGKRVGVQINTTAQFVSEKRAG